MATIGKTTETTVTLRLSSRAKAILAAQAANSGQDISTLASDLIEHVVTRPSIAETMGPVRNEILKRGMNEQELDNLLQKELDAHRREKKAKPA